MTSAPPKASFPSADDAQALLVKLREFALVGAGLASGARGDAFLRMRDLQDAGIIDVRDGFRVGGTGGRNNLGIPNRPTVVKAVDLTPPPAPGGFVATAGITQIQFQTAAPIYSQGHGHARTKVYAAPASPLPTFADAVLYTDFPGNIGVAPFDPASDLRLWATWVSADGVESQPTGGTNGVTAATGLLEDVHIVSLSVNKLLAGELSVGQYIQSSDYVAGTSGFRMQTLGGGDAFLEINGGAIIGGSIIEFDQMRSSNYLLGTLGWRLGSDGTGQIGGVLFTVDGVQSANFVSGSTGFRWDYSGVLEAYAGVFGGSLAAATGTFSGSLTAATGTFAGSLSAATGSFAGSLTAASGTFSGTLTAAAIDAVDTINIAGNAVTFPVSSAESTPINFLGGGEQTLVTAPTFTCSGGPVVIMFSSITTPADSLVTGFVRVRRSGTLLITIPVNLSIEGTFAMPTVVDTPTAGTSCTYTVTYEVNSAGSATIGSFEYRSVYALETKR